jgi:fatty-acyl-CoA synthase
MTAPDASAHRQESFVLGPPAELLDETIGACLRRVALAQGDAEALVSRHQGIRQSYAELHATSAQLALGLLGIGVEKGDRVGIWAPNCAEWTWLQFASAFVGAILVNVNPAYREHELEYALRQSGVKVLVTAESFKSSDYVAMIDSIRDRLPMLERVVVIDGKDCGPAKDLLLQEVLDLGSVGSRDRLAGIEEHLDAHDPINIQYTSGTTGSPKGATLTHHNILNNARLAAQVLGYTPEDRVCIPVPLYHCFGMGIGNLGCVSSGATMVYPAPSFEPLATLEAIQEERCTSIYGVPTMFIGQLDHPAFDSFDLTSLRTGMMGGAPCPVETMKRVIDDMHAAEVCIIYGMTETAPISFITRPDDDLERRVSTVGQVLPGVDVKLVDPVSGAVVPRGEPGEVCTRGYLVMQGYWENDVATAEAIDADGFMHTGDIGVLDDAGYLNIVGRSKDMVIRGGENLYPREIEEVLFQHPAVASAQVVGVPDARMGEELMAWIVLRDGGAVSEDEIRAFCRERLAHFKVPRYVKFVDEFPMTVTGKIQKFKMRETAIEELGLQDAAGIATA